MFTITLDFPSFVALLSLALVSGLYVKLFLRERLLDSPEHAVRHVSGSDGERLFLLPAAPQVVDGVQRQQSASGQSRIPLQGSFSNGRFEDAPQTANTLVQGSASSASTARPRPSPAATLDTPLSSRSTTPRPAAKPDGGVGEPGTSRRANTPVIAGPSSARIDLDRVPSSISQALKARRTGGTAEDAPAHRNHISRTLSATSSLTTPPATPEPTSPGSSPRTALSAATTRYEEEPMDEDVQYQRRTKTIQGVVTSWFSSEEVTLFDNPPDPSACQNLTVGDVFCHAATATDPPAYQLWLWLPDSNGELHWRSVAPGYRREDGRRLILTATRKDPSWVTEDYYRRIARKEKKMDTERRTAKKFPQMNHASQSTSTDHSLVKPAGKDSPSIDHPQKRLVPHADSQRALDLILVRQVTTRPAGDKNGTHCPLETPFFETEGTQPIPSPPPFVGQEDVQVGDIFYYRNTEDWKQSQMWIWCVDPAQGAHWKRVKVGYRREDGRRLTLTEKRRIPSWVGEHWYTRRGVQKRL
ncbi:hypothetical protein BV20DRAFT_1057962 [Pilatotrama ljubarskyi]|nr:hypothetical protein BV20DRAFT_1057962 [Pilatotrama ljubarskyi]